MRYPRTFATPDGESHFEDVDVQHESVAVVPGRPTVDVGTTVATAASNLLRISPNWDGDWHPTPKRWFVITLSGELEITTSDGEIRRFGPGSIWLIEDTTGKGHNTRVVGGEEWVGFGVTLADQSTPT
jgi:hypothetical protein